MLAERASLRWTIECHTGPRAYAPRTRAALAGLGYDLVPADSKRPRDPALRLVDERRFDRIPSASEDPATPIVSLTGTRPLEREDPRIVGCVVRPAALVELYRLIQEALEEHPRKVPRVPAQLAARCVRGDRRWVAAVVSISQGGCLLQCSEPLEPGAHLNVQFALPAGLMNARARVLHRREKYVGLAFFPLPEASCSAIDAFVTDRLARA